MGAPLTRSTGSGADVRRSWAAFGALLVAALAGVLHLLGADSAEVVGTLLFAAVFAVTLLGGRLAGLMTAAVATGLYAWLRRDAVDDAGAAQLGIVVIGRAVSYFVLAYVTHVLRDRLPRLPVIVLPSADSSNRAVADGPRREPVPGPPPAPDAYAVAGESFYEQGYDDYGPVPEQGYDDYGSLPEPGWQAPAAAGAFTGADLGVGAVPEHVGVGGNGLDRETLYEEYGAPPEVGPQVPAGWAQQPEDYGDEIPVGHTGELFLQDLAGPPEAVAPGQVLHQEQEAYYSDEYESSHPGYRDDVQDRHDYQAYRGYDEPQGYAGDLPGYGDQGYDDRAYGDQGYGDHQAYQGYDEPQGYVGDLPGYDGYQAGPAWRSLDESSPEMPPVEEVPHVDQETKLWTAGYFRDRIFDERERARLSGGGFSVVMIQIPDTPFQTLSHRREVALLRELGHQFIRAQVVDHLVHLPDEGHHWFAVVLSDADKTGAQAIERRLRSAIAGYLRNRGLGLEDVQSAALTSPDDDEVMATIWTSLLGESMEDEAAWYS